MLKTVYLLIIVSFFSVLFGFSTSRSNSSESAIVVTPTPRRTPAPNTDPNVDSVELDKTEIYLHCAPGITPRGGTCPEGRVVNIVTKASDADNDILLYEYTVTGGRIEGQGAHVKWDLSGVRPGTYKITVGANDGCGVCGKTITREVVVRECVFCRSDCFCPDLEITGNVEQRGQVITFFADATGGSENFKTFKWTVSSGTITEGQGTSFIKVNINGVKEKTITATVEANGPCSDTCLKTASKSVKIESTQTK